MSSVWSTSEKNRLFIALFLELLICVGIVMGMWSFWQQRQRHQRMVLSAKIDASRQQFPSQTKLNYFYMPSPNWVEHIDLPWLEQSVYYTYNADGLNDSHDYSLVRTPQTLRIVALGDSFTFGQHVSTPDNWTEILEQQLNKVSLSCGIKKVEILNLGVYGYDVEYIAEYFRLVGEKYQPDLIVWYESSTGFSRTNEWVFAESKLCEKMQVDSGSTISPQAKMSCLEQADKKVHELHSTKEVREYIGQKYRNFFNVYSKIPVLIFASEETGEDDALAMQDYLSGFPQASFHPEVPELKKEHRLPDWHPNQAGHRIIADHITKYFQNHLGKYCTFIK